MLNFIAGLVVGGGVIWFAKKRIWGVIDKIHALYSNWRDK